MGDRFGPSESLERTNLRHFAYKEVEVETADGGSSRQERVCFIIAASPGSEELPTMATLLWAEGVYAQFFFAQILLQERTASMVCKSHIVFFFIRRTLSRSRRNS